MSKVACLFFCLLLCLVRPGFPRFRVNLHPNMFFSASSSFHLVKVFSQLGPIVVATKRGWFATLKHGFPLAIIVFRLFSLSQGIALQ